MYKGCVLDAEKRCIFCNFVDIFCMAIAIYKFYTIIDRKKNISEEVVQYA